MERHKQYSVGVYCRLSKDDSDGGDSSSIKTQKEMLAKYVRDNNWTIYDFYLDDGYTGTNFKRPSFERMIEDIEAEKINMVVVKDLSRLGRNYIQTGQYTDIYFPDRGVRFVALNDGVDSLNSDNDIAPFRNILNQMYATDISKKVRSAIQAKKQRGEFVASYAPYGYQKDPDNKNRLIVEDTGAVIVKRIYELCASGHGSPYIMKILNREGIPSPRNHGELLRGKTPKRKYEWGTVAVHNILRSRYYKGDMVQGTYNCSRFKRVPNRRRPSDEWIIMLNTHEAIISDELWHYVQNCLNTRKRVQRNGEPQLFNGFIKCPDCGYALACATNRGVEYYSCGLYRRKGAKYCSQHYINKNVLIAAVLDDIRSYAKLAVTDIDRLAERLAAECGDSEERQIKALSDELQSAEARYAELDRIVEQLYEDKVVGGLSIDRFRKLTDKYEDEQSAVEERISANKTEIERLSANRRDVSAWLELIRKYADIQELDRTVLGELVEKITIGESQVIDGEKHIDITIYYRYVGAVNL